MGRDSFDACPKAEGHQAARDRTKIALFRGALIQQSCSLGAECVACNRAASKLGPPKTGVSAMIKGSLCWVGKMYIRPSCTHTPCCALIPLECTPPMFISLRGFCLVLCMIIRSERGPQGQTEQGQGVRLTGCKAGSFTVTQALGGFTLLSLSYGNAKWTDTKAVPTIDLPTKGFFPWKTRGDAPY